MCLDFQRNHLNVWPSRQVINDCMPTDFHRNFNDKGYFAFDWKKHINNWEFTPLFFLRYFLNIHERKMQRGNPFNFSGGGYGYYPLITFHHIAWKSFYTPMTIWWGGGILITPVCPYIRYMVCPASFLYNWSFDISKTPPLVPKIDHVQPPVTDFFFFFLEINTITCWCSKCDVVNIQTHSKLWLAAFLEERFHMLVMAMEDQSVIVRLLKNLTF